LHTGYVRTYHVLVNVTLSVDPDVVVRARRFAERRGTSLNQLIRDYLADLTGNEDRDTALSELETLWREAPGRSGGRSWTRDELHDRSILR
jgi:hypothetical protein